MSAAGVSFYKIGSIGSCLGCYYSNNTDSAVVDTSSVNRQQNKWLFGSCIHKLRYKVSYSTWTAGTLRGGTPGREEEEEEEEGGMESGSVVVTVVVVVVVVGGDSCVDELDSAGSFSWKYKVYIYPTIMSSVILGVDQ